MSDVTIASPLLGPIQYNGQTYFTGQYFHQMYRNNSDTGGKYKRPGDFMRLIRSIEAYQKYIDAGDIVELTYEQITDADRASVPEGETEEFTDADLASVNQSRNAGFASIVSIPH